MKSTLLVVKGEGSAVDGLLPDLCRLEGLEIEEVSSFGQALEEYADGDPPAGVIAGVDRQRPGFLELLAGLDWVSPRVPFLGLVNGSLSGELPVETGPSLVLQRADRPARQLVSAVAACMPAGSAAVSFRRGVDYLLPALLSCRSVSLDLRCDSGVDAYLEILGGDLWNVYADSLEGVEALEALLYEPVAQARVRTLQTIPEDRHIWSSGMQALGVGTRRLPPRFELEAPPPATPAATGERVRAGSGLKTQALDIAWIDAEKPDELNAAEQQEVDFERHLREGIRASLARDYGRAVEAFQAALEVRPNDRRVMLNLERVRQRLRE